MRITDGLTNENARNDYEVIARACRAGSERWKCGSWREDDYIIVSQDKAANAMQREEEDSETLTLISAYGCSGNATRRVCSSSAAVRGMASWEPRRSDSCWLLAGTPVMGSSRVLRWAMLQDGEMRRSEDELGELMMRGTSAALCSDMLLISGSG